MVRRVKVETTGEPRGEVRTVLGTSPIVGESGPRECGDQRDATTGVNND